MRVPDKEAYWQSHMTALGVTADARALAVALAHVRRSPLSNALSFAMHGSLETLYVFQSLQGSRVVPCKVGTFRVGVSRSSSCQVSFISCSGGLFLQHLARSKQMG